MYFEAPPTPYVSYVYACKKMHFLMLTPETSKEKPLLKAFLEVGESQHIEGQWLHLKKFHRRIASM